MQYILRYIRQSLSWKLSLGILLMAVPIFVLSIGILFRESGDKLKAEATKLASSELNTTMQRMHRYMNAVETATDINDWEILENMQPDSILACSHYIVALNGYIDGCSISMEPNMFPKYGRHFSAYTVREADSVTTVIEKEYDYFDKVWYKAPRFEHKPCWVVYYDESDSLALTIDGMLASYSKPLYNAEDRLVGVISTDLSLLRLSSIIAKEGPYPNSYFMMTGDNGRFILHPDTAQLFKHTIFSDVDPEQNADRIALGYAMTTGKQGSMSVKIDDEPCLVSYQPVPGTSWSLALVCPEKSILQSYNRLKYIISPIITIGLLLILLFCSVTVAHAIHPLYKLTGKVQRITEGHYDERIKQSQNNDVVGRLQNHFATMQESLSRHANDIRQMNDEALKRNEELTKASELAKEADRQKSLFIQNMSHQIRTPLNIIMGFAQVLGESRTATMPEDEVKGITGMMMHNAGLLERMVLMLFDGSARGKMEELYANKNELVSCNEVGHKSIAMVHGQCPDIPIRFVTDLSDDFCVMTSGIYLQRSLTEILYNAVKYSDGQNVLLYIDETGSTIRFIVQDTGPGIAEEEVGRLFEMFTKVDDLSEGLGLGLPLSKRHIDNLGGSLYYDSSYHQGCRFVIELSKNVESL